MTSSNRKAFLALLSTFVLAALLAPGCYKAEGERPGQGTQTAVNALVTKEAAGSTSPDDKTSPRRETKRALQTAQGKETRDERPSRSDLERQSADKIAALQTQPAVRSGPDIEKISGYRTGGEYFLIHSKYFPDAMAVVTLPRDYERQPAKRYPLLIVFGGAGESAKPPRTGALAWMHYYKTDEAVQALDQNRLEAGDFRGLVTPEQLREFNSRLKERPYEGVILVCPYSPLLSRPMGLESPEYEQYIIQELIPTLQKHYRVAPDSIGIDGVSMGGTRSMYFGLKHPDVFASVGAIQGAFGSHLELYAELIKKNRALLAKKAIQLVTSDKDYLAASVEKMHKLLLQHGIPHRYSVLTGPHDYIFNQGPGSLALLIFHNEALNRRSTGPTR